jgi:hypothetical protein
MAGLLESSGISWDPQGSHLDVPVHDVFAVEVLDGCHHLAYSQENPVQKKAVWLRTKYPTSL